MNNKVEVTEINIYPLKSAHRINLAEATLTVRGLQFDRNWMITNSEGVFLTQRQIPQIALIQPVLEDEQLLLQAPGKKDLNIPLDAGRTKELEVSVWNDTCRAYDEGDRASTWLTEFLGQYKGSDLRLVRFADKFIRMVDLKYAGDSGAHTAFADGYPLLIISEESLHDLNARLISGGKTPIEMNRFRPNIVVGGLAPYGEDKVKSLVIGDDVEIEIVKPCARCTVTTIDQEKGARTNEPAEPLRTLDTYRKEDSKVLFGQNAIVRRGEGSALHVGDVVVVKSKI